ncbi:EAL domain-containing protein [Enterobacter bugandensis]|uniref:EAL domain-containing protein n=1 Tax=Enterobacter bugandensis TaxID=881260 RepID=UPI003D6DC3C7
MAVGCEVLVRWLHKENIIPPNQIIQLAEQSGLIVSLTRQLIRCVTDQFAMSFKPENPLYISFNISARHLQSDLLEDILNYFHSRVDSNIRLVLEITAHEIITSDDKVRKNIKQLKARGVKLTLDDFGTGYSTLKTLLYTPVEIIKKICSSQPE